MSKRLTAQSSSAHGSCSSSRSKQGSRQPRRCSRGACGLPKAVAPLSEKCALPDDGIRPRDLHGPAEQLREIIIGERLEHFRLHEPRRHAPRFGASADVPRVSVHLPALSAGMIEQHHRVAGAREIHVDDPEDAVGRTPRSWTHFVIRVFGFGPASSPGRRFKRRRRVRAVDVRRSRRRARARIEPGARRGASTRAPRVPRNRSGNPPGRVADP